MKSIYTTFIVFVFISFQGIAQNANELQVINSQIWSSFSRSFETLDYSLFESLHHDDFTRISGDSKQIKNKETYINGYVQRWKNSDTKQTISFRFLERFYNEDHASERGIYDLKINPNTDLEKSYYGKFHVVLTKVNGTWKILVDYDSSEGKTIGQDSYQAAYSIDDYEKY